MDFAESYFQSAWDSVAFGVGQSLASLAGTGATFVLFYTGQGGRGTEVRHLAISSSVANLITVATLRVDPVLTAGNAPTNLSIGGPNSRMSFEAQVVAPPTFDKTLAILSLPTNGYAFDVLPGPVVLRPGTGLLISSNPGVATVSVTLGWTEPPAEPAES